MELDLDALLTSIRGDAPLADVSALHQLIVSREIEDIETIDIKNLCDTIWFFLERCWHQKDYYEREKLTWETVTWLLSLPSFTSTDESLSQIGSTVPHDFCVKLLASCERDIQAFVDHGAHLLRWLYVRVPSLRRCIRASLGSRLVKHAQSPEALRVANINPQLRLMGDIIAGCCHSSRGSGRDMSALRARERERDWQLQRCLLVDVLLPLHRPNQMVQWRDQVPVLQLYHESLVRCLVRLVQWEQGGAAGTGADVDTAGDVDAPMDGGADEDEEDEESQQSSRRRPLATWQEGEEEQPLASSSSSFPCPRSCALSASSWRQGRAGESLLVEAVRTILEELWPEGFNTNTPKEVLLLHEVETLLELASEEDFSLLLDAVLNRLKISLMHDNVRTIQRALQFFRNEPFLKHIRPHAATVIRRLLPSLYRRGQLFWNVTVNKMTATVLKLLLEMDEESFASTAEDEAGGAAPQCQDTQTPLTPHTPQQQHQQQPLPIKRSLPPSTDGLLVQGLARTRPQPLGGGDATSAEAGPPRVPGAASSSSSSSSSSSAVHPPVSGGVNAPRGSMRQQILAASSTGSSTPPLTITGVAPWAVQHQQQFQQRTSTAAVGSETGSQKRMMLPPPSSTAAPATAPSAPLQPSQATGLELVRLYMRNCRIVGKGGKLSNCEGGAINEEDEEDEDAPSWWARGQASLMPSKLPELRFHDLVFGKILGEGSFGTVKYARQIIKGPDSRRSEWPEFAVKVLHRPRLQALGRDCLQLACRELAALHALSHPGVARLVSAFRYTDGYYLVLEYASRGDLHTYVLQQGRLSEPQARFVLGEVCAALLSLHALGLAFNDLKPENVLLTEVGHVKLADFGACRAVTAEGQALLSQGNVLLHNLRDGDWKEPTATAAENSQSFLLAEQVEQKEDHPSREAEGTPGYLPPEALSHSRAPDLLSDSWALGCVLHFCLAGRPRYFGSSFAEVLQQITDERGTTHSHAVHFDSASSAHDATSQVLQSLSPHTTALMTALMQFEPSSRLSVADACLHPFFSQSLAVPGAEEGVDPRLLHEQEPLVVLPRLSESQQAAGGGVAGEDRAWARRQCSMVWSPMPQTYDFGAEGTGAAGRAGGVGLGVGVGSAGRLLAALEGEVIAETAAERGGSWL